MFEWELMSRRDQEQEEQGSRVVNSRWARPLWFFHKFLILTNYNHANYNDNDNVNSRYSSCEWRSSISRNVAAVRSAGNLGRTRRGRERQTIATRDTCKIWAAREKPPFYKIEKPCYTTPNMEMFASYFFPNCFSRIRCSAAPTGHCSHAPHMCRSCSVHAQRGQRRARIVPPRHFEHIIYMYLEV